MLRFICFTLICCCSFGQESPDNHSTGLVPEDDDSLLIFSTLDGSLIGVEQLTGQIKWNRNDEPAVKVPHDELSIPMFLPDPRDGSLYLFGPDTEALKKLPFTIPQLVATSPCRSSDGILYTGRKIDTWFSINPKNGERKQLLGFEQADNTCPIDTRDTIFVGRTEYNVIMIDSKHKDRKWNVTFYDYSTAKMDPKFDDDYNYVHFSGSSSGRVVTLDKRYGTVLWDIDLGSPVIGVYSVNKDGLLLMPFTNVADNTLNHLLQKFSLKSSDFQLFPTLYVGEHRYGLYALPSLVDSSTATITSKAGQLLLEGPLLSSQFNKSKSHKNVDDVEDENEDNDKHRKDVIRLGHYEVPAEYKPHNQPLQITGRSDKVITSVENVSTTLIDATTNSINQTTEKKDWRKAISAVYLSSKKWLNQQENKGLMLLIIILFGVVIAMFWYVHARFQYISRQYDQSSRDSSRTGSNNRNDSIYVPEDVGEGLFRIGKITFNTKEFLGQGCDGTFVYKGEFDGRLVAVKRLLPQCFTFADREVALLRESDAHANVVRYFCTEQDKSFRYIALELAEATLQDYVTDRYNKNKISVKSILRQATSGLAHLHSLDIVHRDIKPHNVLLSVPGPRGEVRAMISDFGLCKKLQHGRASFSRKSGATGTDGWIAPEMLNGERTTSAVDIFSLGCVFYYVLSEGKHPFGKKPVHWQANILSGEYDISGLSNISENDKEVSLILIKAMIDSDPKQRPPAQAVHDYPIFWDSEEVLTFFQNVSDSVETLVPESPAMRALETNNRRVCNVDWRETIDTDLAQDLRRYRTYRGDSVRDLLRALRNKKNHYRELTPAAQKILGEVPAEFAEYWLSKFPLLLIHSWCVMQDFRSESSLKKYYSREYTFNYENEAEDRERVEMITNWRVRSSVDWSPNKARYRGPRKKPDRKKVEIPNVWLPPAS